MKISTNLYEYNLDEYSSFQQIYFIHQNVLNVSNTQNNERSINDWLQLVVIPRSKQRVLFVSFFLSLNSPISFVFKRRAFRCRD